MKKKIVVECKPDEILAVVLGFSRKEIAHENNKGEVCHYLEKSAIKLAIIDEDPGSGQPRYLRNFKVVEEKFSVITMVYKKFDKTIIVIKPRLEEWILMQCQNSGINPGDFFLPADAKRLKDIINLKLDKFQRLLDDLVHNQNEGVKHLQKIV